MLTRFLRVLQKDKTVEWSISNSTLEEVFLKLCSLFEGVNAHAAKESEKAACLICVRKPTESVFLFTALGIKVFVANVVCRSCAEGTTTNDPGSLLGGEMIDYSTFQSLNNSQPQQIAAQTTRQLMQPQQNEYDLKNVSQVAILSSQVKAIVLKNFILDYRLWKTNCCTILLILILNGLLAFISSSLSGGYDRISERCPGGFTYFDQNSYTRKCNPMSFMASSSCTSSLSTNQFFSNSICKSYTGVYSELSPLVGGSTYQDSYSSYSLKAVSYYFRSNYSDYYTSRISYMQNKGRIWYTDSSASGDVTLQSVLDPTFFRFTNLSQSKTILLSSFPEFRKISTSVDSAVTSAQLNLQSLANSNNKCGILGSIFTSADVLNVLSIINDSYPDVGLNIKSFNPKSNQFSVELFYMPLSSALKSFPSAYITQNDDYYSEQNPTVCYGYGWADQIYASSNYLQRFTDDPTRGILNTLANSLLRSSLNLPPLTYNLLNNSSETPIILANFSRMPQFFTDSNSNPLQTFVNSISIAIILLATMFMLPRLVALWVNERVLHLTEMMRVQGLYTSTYWAANYIYGMLTVGLCTFLSFVITLAIQPVLQNNAGLVIIVFIIWIHSQVCLSILISSVFKKPVTASMISYLFIIISVIVTLFLLFIMSGPLGDIIPIAANIFPPIAFASALNLCMNAGFGFNTRYSIIVAIFFFASTGIGMLGIYLHLIQPGQLGVAAMDPFFGLVKLAKKKRGDRQLEAGKVDDDKSFKIDEDVLKEKKFCRETIEKSDPMSAVKIANLRKVYGTKKIAVKDVSLNIQFGEVFGLLGVSFI